MVQNQLQWKKFQIVFVYKHQSPVLFKQHLSTTYLQKMALDEELTDISVKQEDQSDMVSGVKASNTLVISGSRNDLKSST